MMNRKNLVATGLSALTAAAMLAGLSGCVGTVLRNLTKQRTGDITMVFINNTSYTAAFSYGTWDAWDRTPGTPNLQQLRLAPNTASEPATVPCARNAAIGTQDFVDRVIATKADEALDDFDPDAFDTVVRFSSAPSDSGAAGLPTEGTALGIEKLLGVDYSCADQLVFTFVEDPDAPGGFRIDFEVILDKLPG